VYRLARPSIVKACSWDRVTAVRKTLQLCTASLALAMLSVGSGLAQAKTVVLVHGSSTISLEPYARNIVRVTLSTLKDQALAAPGYGFVAPPSDDGWTYEHTETADIYKSSRLIISVATKPPQDVWLPLASQVEIANFFDWSGAPRVPPERITVTTPEGKTLLTMKRWFMRPPDHDQANGNTEILNDRRASDAPFYQVGATFASPNDEHYYGLGQNQEGFLDHRGRSIACWSNYVAAGGESYCVPFIVTNKGYGLIWDNPSKTTVEPGFNEQSSWVSQVGDRVSFFVIAGNNTDEIYSGYRLLTGATPLLPRGAYGFIQSKERYSTQEEVLAVAKGYRERNLPADVLVVDFFYFTKMGQMDFDAASWPDPAAMNRKLHEMGFQSMISVWPRFAPGSRYYDLLLKNGWFEHLANGMPTTPTGLPNDPTGSNIDTTNPQAARWYWDVIRENLISKGFDGIWTDETEPDIPPNGSYLYIGPGTQYFNPYPLFHTAAIYDGFRRDEKHRAVILARAAYLGAQRNGAIFWSSDIYPTWDTLARQVPAGLGVTASGIAYWANDIGGFLNLPDFHHLDPTPLIDPSDARNNVGGYDDYPELFVRWFEYGAFNSIFRTHGSRVDNEVWSYGKQAEPILEKYLRLRYQLMPYIYSLGYNTYKTGAPYMRARFMDFPNDPKVADLGDEYMFGPAFLVAPVTSQGKTTKSVYLPAGTAWYNYWSGERVEGGQTIRVNAAIDTIPLFVKAGSIVPLGSVVESTHDQQSIAHVKVFAGANGDFTLYNDDGQTYAYEKGESQITQIHWDDASGKLTQTGAHAWNGDGVLEVVRGK
jgi:alpha-D-xyloside xylohydrolase